VLGLSRRYVADGNVKFFGCDFQNNVAREPDGGKDLHVENGDVYVGPCGHGFYPARTDDGLESATTIETSRDDFASGTIRGPDSGPLKVYYRCDACQRGYFTEDASEFKRCDPCDPGYFSPDLGAYLCFACPLGSFSDTPGSSNCTGCPAGTRGQREGLAAKDECSPCRQGSYSFVDGAEECSLCPLNHYSYVAGSTDSLQCKPCSGNTFSTTTRNACQMTTACDTVVTDGVLSLPSFGECVPCNFGRSLFNLILSLASFALVVAWVKHHSGHRWPLAYLKSFLNFAQCMSLIAVADVGWPASVQSVSSLLWYEPVLSPPPSPDPPHPTPLAGPPSPVPSAQVPEGRD
jgi:hypothetical protein